MTLFVWGRGLLLWGLVALVVSAAPLLLTMALPSGLGGGFFELLAIMLGFSVVPLCAVVAVTGAILLLVAVVSRDRPSRGGARAPSPRDPPPR
jgi:hypothetical protein